jgi:3-isopropylmalate/(R)-2-methylmalate dehydratase small subunit
VVTLPEWDEPLPTLDGRAWAFGLEISAAQILASAHARLAPADARHHLFSAIDPSLAGRLAPDDVIVAEEMIGTLDEAQAALAALAAAGVKALVARHFSSAFAIAGGEQGLVLLVLDTPSFIHTDDRVRLDLDAGKVVNLSSGDRAPIRNLDDAERAALRLTLVKPRSTR